MKPYPVKRFSVHFLFLFALNLFLINSLPICYAVSFQDTLPLIEDYIQEVKKNSLEIKISLQSKEALIAANKTEKLLFQYKSHLNSEWKFYPSREEETASIGSLFLPPSHYLSRSNVNTYSLTHSKLWSKGVLTSLEAQLMDSKRQSLLNLGLSFKTDLFRDLFSQRLSWISPKIQAKDKVVLMKSKREVKNVLIQALLSLAEILEMENEILLQNQFCQTISQQTENFKEKRKKRFISKRELLQSLKELTTCLIYKKNLLKQSSEKKKTLKANYGVRSKKYFSLKMDAVFEALHTLFLQPEFQEKDLSLEDNEDILSLKNELKTLKFQTQNSKALSRFGLKLELKGGLSSNHNARLFPLQEELFSSPDPYILAKLTLELPFKNKEALLMHKQQIHQILALEHQISFLEEKKKSRFQTLNQNLKKDFSIYQDLKEKMSLSKDILFEANKDFENGRMDFYILSNFQKERIEGEKDLSKIRSKILIQIVEYLNDLNFFDQYLNTNSSSSNQQSSKKMPL